MWDAQGLQLLLMSDGHHWEDAVGRTWMPGVYRLAFDAEST